MPGRAATRRYRRRELLRRTSMLGLGTGLATTAGATGCVGQDPPERVTLVRYEDATAGHIWEEVLRAFRREHPEVDVEYENVPASSWSEFFDTVSVRIAGGNVPDVVQVASEGQRLFADRGLAEPIDDLVERDSAELADYFAQVHPNLIQWTNGLTTPGDRTYYLPVGFNTMAIYYSVEALDRAGVAEPAEDWTWEEFLGTCEELATGLDGGYAMHVDPAYFGGVMPWLLTNGANTLNADWTAHRGHPGGYRGRCATRAMVPATYPVETGMPATSAINCVARPGDRAVLIHHEVGRQRQQVRPIPR